MVAIATLGAGVIGAGASIYGSSEASGEQKKAANASNALQLATLNFNTLRTAPFVNMGTNAANMLGSSLGDLTSPITSPDVVMDQAALEKTPGYQFTLNQGLKAVQNSAAARGLGVSGAALRGAADYTTGLADSTYTNQFNLANVNRQTDINLANLNKTNAYNFLAGQTALGANTAVGVGSQSNQVAQNIGQNTIGAANAGAAATMSQAGAIGSAANSIPQALLLRNLLGGGGGGGYFGGGSQGSNAFGPTDGSTG